MRLVATDIEATYAVTRAFRVPFHSGGALHGLLGRALRKVTCFEAEQCADRPPCTGPCGERGRCEWSRLFDPAPVHPAPHRILSGANEPPPPVIVLAPPPGARELTAGDEWRVGVRVFGRGRDADQGRIERALGGIADMPVHRDEGRVELRAITRFVPRELVVGDGGDGSAGHVRAGRVVVRFETPARLKRNGQLMEPGEIDFAALFDHVWRRLTMMAALYGEYGAEDDATFRRLREAAGAVATVERRLRVVRWEHLSAESRIRKPLAGVMGHLVFEGGGLDVLRPVLTAGEIVHVGGSTSFGLGCMQAAMS